MPDLFQDAAARYQAEKIVVRYQIKPTLLP